MNKLNFLKSASITTILLSAVSFNSYAMDPYIETALIDVCKSAMSNSVSKYSKTAKLYNLKDKVISNKVVCNGDNIVDFAEKHGSYKVADRLNKHSGDVEIIDVAQNQKWSVTFDIN